MVYSRYDDPAAFHAVGETMASVHNAVMLSRFAVNISKTISSPDRIGGFASVYSNSLGYSDLTIGVAVLFQIIARINRFPIAKS